MKILAIIIIILSGIEVISTPLLFGKPREAYSYRTFIATLISFGMLLPLCLYVINHN